MPLDGSTITDDGRIRAASRPADRLTGAGAKVVVTAHLGPAEGRAGPGVLALAGGRAAGPAARPRVALATDVVGESAHAGVAGLCRRAWRCWRTCAATPGRRARTRASATTGRRAGRRRAGAAFVSDGFGVVHREQASVVEVARKLRRAYGGDLWPAETEGCGG